MAMLAQNGATLFKRLALIDLPRDLYRDAAWIEENFHELRQ